ncbi:hypothetical protein COB55_05615 [Candidatus Wolfebacteria bacterium]|nr:MAG: hypothetical protein COB55_05615 [Candidatus Wolfebacteria bacterium]
MKTLFKITILMIISLISFNSCTNQEQNRQPTGPKPHQILIKNLKSPHKLIKLFTRTKRIKGKEEESSTSSSGGFFFVIGGYSYDSNTKTKIVDTHKSKIIISWLHNNGQYIISEIPLYKTRIQFGEEKSISFYLKDKFLKKNCNDYHCIEKKRVCPWPNTQGHRKIPEWNIVSYFNNSPTEFFEVNLSYAVLTIPEEDWEEQIQLPLNQKENNDYNISGIDEDK